VDERKNLRKSATCANATHLAKPRDETPRTTPAPKRFTVTHGFDGPAPKRFTVTHGFDGPAPRRLTVTHGFDGPAPRRLTVTHGVSRASAQEVHRHPRL
jgi:hypothetical protein